MEKPTSPNRRQQRPVPKPTAVDKLKEDARLIPCDKLIANLKRVAENNDPRQRVVLFQTGSYNPVHRMHVEMFEMVKKFIESDAFEKPSVVVGAYVRKSVCFESNCAASFWTRLFGLTFWVLATRFMSPSHDKYVSNKMNRAKGGPQHAYSSEARLKMLQLATASSDWIQISPIESSRPSFRAFNGVRARKTQSLTLIQPKKSNTQCAFFLHR